MKRAILAAALAFCHVHVTAQQVSVKIPILITKIVQTGNPAVPFKGIGKLTALKGSTESKEFSCDDISDASGMLTCFVACNKDADMMSLKIVPPLNDIEPALGFYTPTGKYLPIRIESCKVSSATPVNIVYRSYDAAVRALAASNPQLFNTVATISGGVVSFKPFASTSSALLDLDPTEENKADLLELSVLARTYSIAKKRTNNAFAVSNLEQYESGAKNVLLQVESLKYMRGGFSKRIIVSSDKDTLQQNIKAVEKELTIKPELDAKEKIMVDKLQRIQR